MQHIHRLVLVAMLCFSGQLAAAPADRLVLAHPDKSGAQIEYFVITPQSSGPWPTLIFLHGYQDPTGRTGGKVYVDWGVLDRYAAKGNLAVSISLPGFGGSSGPSDFAGPITQHAVDAVIAELVMEHRAALGKVLIQGVSLGAVTAALVASYNETVAGLVLISGLYDLPTYFQHPESAAAMGIKLVAIAQTDGSDEALRSRSALFSAARIKADTLILNGAKDDRTDANQARLFADAINAAGGHARVHIYPQFGHTIPIESRDAEVDAFIAATLER